MSADRSTSRRRSFGSSSAVASAIGVLLIAGAGCTRTASATDGDASAAQHVGQAKEKSMSSGAEVRPLRLSVPDAALVDLRQRIAATRWPDRETVTDRSQGIQLAKPQELVQYWGSGYDWRKVEAKLDALPQFTTSIDGVDIHFIHVRSRHKERASGNHHARFAGLPCSSSSR